MARAWRWRLAAWAAAAMLVAGGVSFGLVELVGLQAGSTATDFATPSTRHYGHAPAYTLTDQEGRRFPSSRLAGKVQIVTYLFPYCTSYCPLTARRLAEAEQMLRADGLMSRVAFVAFNVDPAGSGPAQERAFLREYGISPTDPAWHYLTGTPRQVRRVVTGGFHIYYKKVSLAAEAREERRQRRAGTFQAQPDEPNPLASKAAVTYDIVHNDSIDVVGPDGRIVRLFGFGDQVTPQQLVAAARPALNG